MLFFFLLSKTTPGDNLLLNNNLTRNLQELWINLY